MLHSGKHHPVPTILCCCHQSQSLIFPWNGKRFVSMCFMLGVKYRFTRSVLNYVYTVFHLFLEFGLFMKIKGKKLKDNKHQLARKCCGWNLNTHEHEHTEVLCLFLSSSQTHSGAWIFPDMSVKPAALVPGWDSFKFLVNGLWSDDYACFLFWVFWWSWICRWLYIVLLCWDAGLG